MGRRKYQKIAWMDKVGTTTNTSWLKREQSRLIAEIQKHQNLINEYQERLGESNNVQIELEELEKQEEKARTVAHSTRQNRPGFFDRLSGDNVQAVWKRKLAEQEKAHAEIYKKLWEFRKDNFDIEMSHQIRNANTDIAIKQTKLKFVNERLSELMAKIEKEQSKQKAKKEREQIKLKAKKEKEQIQRAIVARANRKSRRAAKTIKTKLHEPEFCPYCDKEISGLPHADHIFPIAMGGLSIEHNMVHVCADCNLAKSDKTLLEFCELTGQDFNQIVKVLRGLGKRV